MTTHQVIIANQQAKRLAVIDFKDDGDWVLTAKGIALNWLEDNDKVFHSWHAANGALTVWTDVASKCYPFN